MFMSVRRYDNVTSVGEVCQRIALSFVPLLKKMPGFITYYAVDGGGGTMATISVFSTQQMAEESNAIALAWMKENVADLQPDLPAVVAGRVEVTASAV